MKKTILILAAVATLPLAACNRMAPEEITSCTFDVAQNTKTCTLTANERQDLYTSVQDTVKVVDGVSYRQQPDGSLKPIN